jgi:NAD(P)-dependent dehydrogenase (short-subunit alcohol dehydrogenase family)
VRPGWVAANLWQRDAQGLQQELGVESEEETPSAARKNSLNRFGKPDELASAIVFFVLCACELHHRCVAKP